MSVVMSPPGFDQDAGLDKAVEISPLSNSSRSDPLNYSL